MTRRFLLSLALVFATLFGGAPYAAAATVDTTVSQGVRADTGARVVAEQWLSDRMVDITVDSRALGATANVRLLLPPGWAADPHRRWPVLYLLHGCCDSYVSWTRSTDVEELTARTDVIVAMPEAGAVGFYSDWWNHGTYGTPGWETFHLSEVRQLLERGWRAGSRRAVAGLSMGGFGALSYAARHPMLFRAAASYSGVVHTRQTGGPELVKRLADSNGQDWLALWGDPERDAAIWAAHNPYDLAHRLRGRDVYVASGDGRPGPFDNPDRPVDPLEAQLDGQSKAFAAHARAAHVRVTTNFYGPGTHGWRYWERELHASFPMLMRAIGVTPGTA